jgi:hypothetical protein
MVENLTPVRRLFAVPDEPDEGDASLDAYLAEWEARDLAENPPDRYRERNIPPEYRGQTWDYGSGDNVVHCPFPPYKFDPMGPICDEFADFRRYHGEQTGPDNSCEVHHRFLAKWEYEARTLNMNGCSWCYPELATARALELPIGEQTRRRLSKKDTSKTTIERYSDV